MPSPAGGDKPSWPCRPSPHPYNSSAPLPHTKEKCPPAATSTIGEVSSASAPPSTSRGIPTPEAAWPSSPLVLRPHASTPPTPPPPPVSLGASRASVCGPSPQAMRVTLR
eukprot:scaffold113829_cov30-Tisochrysis_lutea.AAC.2